MKTLLASTALVLAAGVAGAATVTETINLRGSGGLTGSHSNFGASVALTAEGFESSNGVLGGRRSVGRWNTGLGVQKRGRYDSHEVDGAGPDEMLVLSFGQTVTVTGVKFTYFSHSDDFDLAVYDENTNGAPTLRAFNSDLDISGFSSFGRSYNNQSRDVGSATLSGANLFTGTIFGFGADHYSDSFKISEITVSYETSPVPLPAAGWLLIAGLGGLAAARRRS